MQNNTTWSVYKNTIFDKKNPLTAGTNHWELAKGGFESFDLAHAWATTNICPDYANEPHYRADPYWFSDVQDANEPYKVVIGAYYSPKI